MLSYRHAFHAGNHADVLKHIVLSSILDYLNQKDKPYYYIDTHAGAGLYELTSEYSSKNSEFKSGISMLWQCDDCPQLVKNYINLVKKFNKNNELIFYPGSPLIANSIVRECERLQLFELHSNESKILKENFKDKNNHVQLFVSNGFDGLLKVLPPITRRGLILIDPSYEDKSDYQRVFDTVCEATSLFATGTYVIWYPYLQRPEINLMVESLKKLPLKTYCNFGLKLKKPSDDGFGMYGSGVFVINPPWIFNNSFDEVMPYLAKVLAIDETSSFEFQYKDNTR